MSGWVKLHRALVDKPIWQTSTPEQKVILITLLLKASHREKEWEFKGDKYLIKPGQFITSLPSLVELCGNCVTIQMIRTALKRFEKYGFLTDESTNKNRLITIMNWELYQGNDDEPNRQSNSQLTGNQQAANRQLTAIKNEKNIKNDKNDKELKDIGAKKFTPPSLDQVGEYCVERKNNINPENFINFYESKGWMVGKNKMKDWKAAIRTWETKNKERNGNAKPSGNITENRGASNSVIGDQVGRIRRKI